ncbi:MAG: hypothetical protein AAFV72_21610 [Cyanobacteria bacterium J06635_1]
MTNPDQIEAVVDQAQDVEILINNAGVLGSGGVFAPDSAIANLLSIASVVNVPVFAAYSASKAALYSFC